MARSSHKLAWIATLLALCVLSISDVKAQNIIQNGDFEQYHRLPQNEGDLDRAKFWQTLVQSADYLNYTYAGWTDQHGGSYSGKGYAGFANYGNAKGSVEAITQEINGRIDDNTSYLLSFYAKRSTGGTFYDSCSKLELYVFTEEPPLNRINIHASELGGNSRVWQAKSIPDTNWTRQIACINLPKNLQYLALTAEKKSNCWQYTYIDKIEIRKLTVDLGPDSTMCEGESIQLVSDWPTGTFQWEDGSTDSIRIVRESGTYSLSVQQNGCSAIGSVTYEFKKQPSLDLGKDSSICVGDSITLNIPTSFASYSWSGNHKGTSTVLKNAEKVILTVFDNVCYAKDTLEVKTITYPVVNLGKDTVFCPGFNLRLMVFQNGAKYVWSTGSTKDYINIEQAGKYWVEVRKQQCASSDTVQVDQIPPPDLNLGGNQTWCSGDTILLAPMAQNNHATYLWSDSSNIIPRITNEPGKYVLAAFHPCGDLKDSVEISFGSCSCEIELPNAFTPQFDGLNETFKSVYQCEFDFYELKLYNRWGELIFETSNPEDSWNGTYLGKTSPSGVYGYHLRYQGRDLGQQFKSGTVTLLR